MHRRGNQRIAAFKQESLGVDKECEPTVRHGRFCGNGGNQNGENIEHEGCKFHHPHLQMWNGIIQYVILYAFQVISCALHTWVDAGI